MYTATDHGLPQIIYVDPIVSKVGHAMVHPYVKYGLILTLLPMYLDKGRGVLAKNPIFEVYTALDHGLPQIIYLDPIVSSVWHAMVHPCAKYGLILTLLPMYLDKLEGVLGKTLYIILEVMCLLHQTMVYST